MFCCKTYKYGKDVMVAVCDKEVLGKEFLFGDVNFKVKKGFYGEDVHSKEEIKKILKDATIINAVGKNIVNLLIKEGLIDERYVMKIGDTLHAQMVKL